MRPILTVYHEINNCERIVFECDHARTMADSIGGDGGTLRTSMQYVLARHTETCRCKPEVIEDLYASMAYMREGLERDLATVAPADPAVLALAHSNLESIRRHDCPCDPHVITTSKLGVIEFIAYHRDGCKQKVRKGRTYGMLDFSSRVSA